VGIAAGLPGDQRKQRVGSGNFVELDVEALRYPDCGEIPGPGSPQKRRMQSGRVKTQGREM